MGSAQLVDLYHEFSNDIFVACREFNFHPSSQQAEVLMDIQNATFDFTSRRVAAKSGQGTGKTTASAVGGMWRTLRADDARTFVTAPTMRQCHQVWLAEASKRLEYSNQWIRDRMVATASKITVAKRPGKWDITFFTATKSENAQGLHNEHMTIICEEASGIPGPLIEQIDGTIKNHDFLWLMIGNPNSRLSKFFDCFNGDRANWQCRTLSAHESPHVSKKLIQDQIDKYGADSDFVKVRVDGEFPNVDPDCVFAADDLEKCSKLDLLRLSQIPNALGFITRQIGIDLARFGGDESVIYARLGHAVMGFKHFAKMDPNVAIEKAFELQMHFGWTNNQVMYVADATGMGQGCMRNFYTTKHRVMEFHNHGTSTRPEYDNAITEAYFHLRDLVRTRRVYIPNDSVLIAQLTTRRYWLTKQGKYILESKDDYMDRGYPSPDRADALAMCFYEGCYNRAKISRPDNTAAKKLGLTVRT